LNAAYTFLGRRATTTSELALQKTNPKTKKLIKGSTLNKVPAQIDHHGRVSLTNQAW